MIYDTIDNALLYTKAIPRLHKAMAFVKKISSRKGLTEDGRYPIDGDDLYASISSYRTREDRGLPFEAHRKYIDVQFMLYGEELIDVAHGKRFRLKDRYEASRDVLFIHCPRQYSSIVLTPAHFTVLYPHDYHRPCQSVDSPAEARKLVVKIRLT